MKTRTIRLIRPPTPDDPGVVCIVDCFPKAGDKATFYVFQEIPCDIGGRAFAMHRLGIGTLYHVRVGAPAECSCECMGFLSKGKCKHVQGLLALTGHGLV